MKKAFTLLAAIFIMLIISTFGILSLNISSLSLKNTSDIYLQTQADILSDNIQNIALLLIKNNPCKDKFSLTYLDIFDIDIKVKYFGTCKDKNAYKKAVLIDCIIKSKNHVSTEKIREFRRFYKLL